MVYTFAITNGITVRQQLTPDALQGRVNTTGRLITLGGTPAGALIGGLAADGIGADGIGAQITYLLARLPVIAGGLVIWFSPVRRLRL